MSLVSGSDVCITMQSLCMRSGSALCPAYHCLEAGWGDLVLACPMQ